MKKVTFPKNEQELMDFRHEQTVKRWESKSRRKHSKIVYLSDYINDEAGGHSKVLVDTGEKNHQKKLKRKKVNGPKKFIRRPVNAKQVHFKRNPNEIQGKTLKTKKSKLKRHILQRRAALLQSLVSTEDSYRTLLHWSLRLDRAIRLYNSSFGWRRQYQKPRLEYLKFRVRSQLRCISSGGLSTPTTAPPPQQGTDSTSVLRLQELPEISSLCPPSKTSLPVDRRTGRYPQLLSPTQLDDFHSTCSFDQIERTKKYCLEPTVVTETSPSGPSAKQKSQGRLPVGPHVENVMTDFVEDLVFSTLQKLYHEQKELKRKNKVGFRAKMRYVVGLQETIKHLRAGDVKLVILAADLEMLEHDFNPECEDLKKEEKGTGRKRFETIEEAVQTIRQLCGSTAEEPVIPVICCMSRQRLAYALFAKNSRISCVGVLQADTSRPYVKALILAAKSMTELYRELVLEST